MTLELEETDRLSGPARRPDGGVDPRDPFPGLLRLLIRSFSRRHKQCHDARFVTVDVEVDRAAAQKLLPFWMRLGAGGRATFFVVDYRRPTFTGPYREAGLMLHVRTLFGSGWHCCWMVLDDDDSAMIYGRETLGYPKKRATIEWEETGDRVIATVRRRGIELIRLEASKGRAESVPAPIFDRKTFNIGGIGNFLAFCTGWCFRITEDIRESRQSQVDLEIAGSVDDPLHELTRSARVSLPGRFASTDITGLRYLFPLGMTGPAWFANTYVLRFR